MLILLIAGMLSRYGFEFETPYWDDSWGKVDDREEVVIDSLKSPVYIGMDGFRSDKIDQSGSLGMYGVSSATDIDSTYLVHFYARRTAPTANRNRYWGVSLRKKEI